MTEKTEALRLADALMTLFPTRKDGEQAAAELRCLSAENETLKAQRDALLEALKDIAGTDPVDAALDPQRAVRIARAAIKAVEENT